MMVTVAFVAKEIPELYYTYTRRGAVTLQGGAMTISFM
jgi:hypothetical protein